MVANIRSKITSIRSDLIQAQSKGSIKSYDAFSILIS